MKRLVSTFSRSLFVVLVGAQLGSAQWINFPAPGVPRLPNGKANLAAKSPRLANGKPDLSGVWHVDPTTMDEWRKLVGPDAGKLSLPGMEMDTISKYATNLFIDLKPADIPERPEAARVRQARLQSGIRDNPSTHCLPHGIPIASLVSEVTKIVETPTIAVVMYETDSTHRQIYTDGRKLPVDPNPAWLGYSVGHWEGNTLAVETAGFNDKSWLDLSGHAHSDSLRIRERYTRRDYGHMDVETTFEDPAYYTRPFGIKVTFLVQPDQDILESFCNENEKDRTHLRAQ